LIKIGDIVSVLIGVPANSRVRTGVCVGFYQKRAHVGNAIEVLVDGEIHVVLRENAFTLSGSKESSEK